LVVAILAALASSSTPYVVLTRQRLINPLTAIHSAFDHVEAERTWEDSVEKLFSAATEEDRLNVGPMLVDEGTTAFGVSRRPHI
jgi:hypothetical protein